MAGWSMKNPPQRKKTYILLIFLFISLACRLHITGTTDPTKMVHQWEKSLYRLTDCTKTAHNKSAMLKINWLWPLGIRMETKGKISYINGAAMVYSNIQSCPPGFPKKTLSKHYCASVSLVILRWNAMPSQLAQPLHAFLPRWKLQCM